MASSNLATGAERKYRNTIDWGTGVSMGNLGMYEYDGESVFARGIDVSLRYTRIIGEFSCKETYRTTQPPETPILENSTDLTEAYMTITGSSYAQALRDDSSAEHISEVFTVLT